ncbi:hypothetical protein [Streptomyces sp. NPDC003832]
MYFVAQDQATPLGDLRAAGSGVVIKLYPGAAERKDWGRYQDAIAAAIGRGAEVVWLT